MAMMSYLKNRKSIRDFQDKSLTGDEISNIKNAFNEIKEKFDWGDFNLEVYEDGEEIYRELENKAGYAGVMIKSPGYIHRNLKNQDKLTYVHGAFVLGELITRLVDFGLGNCVITLGDNLVESKKKLFGEMEDGLDYLIAIGHSTPSPALKKDGTYSSRKPVEEIAFLDADFRQPANEKLRDLNMLELFSAIRYAPSYRNKQPWRFVITNSEVHVYVQNDEDLRSSLTDVGIIMYYFQEMAKTMGIKGNWEIVSELVPDRQFIELGRFNI